MQTKSNTMAPPRKIVRGAPDPQREGTFLLTLDDQRVVETSDLSIAQAAKKSIELQRFVELDLETGEGGRQHIVELRILTAEASAEVARQHAPPATGTLTRLPVPEIPPHAIVDATELTEQLRLRAQQFNVLSPAIAISQIAQGYVANLAAVHIDITIVDETTGRGTDTYRSKKIHKPNERALSKNGLVKISQAFGVKWVPEQCVPLPTYGERNLWRWKYFGYYVAHDGQPQPLMGSKELDLRDGSSEIFGMSSAQIQQMRSFGNEICETKAMERAIRSLGVRQVYTVEDLSKPFLIPRFSFAPDMNDPEIKKLVTERALSGMGILYPGASPMPPALPPAGDDIDQAMPTQTSPKPSPPSPNPFAEPASQPGSSDGSAGGGDAAAATDELPPGATTILGVKYATGKHPTTRRDWRRADVTFANGQIASTFSESLHRLIDEAAKHKLPVRIETAENEGYDDKLVSLSLVDRRQQTLPIADGGSEKY